MGNDKQDALPEEFLEQVKTALENLYDFPYLHRHPLAGESAGGGQEPAGHLLRRELIAAIESLNPGANVAVRSGPARLYNLLHMHYVGGMTLQETANDLGISLRQAYRDLRRGQESVGEILLYNRQPEEPEPEAPAVINNGDVSEASSIQTEVKRLQQHITSTNITEIVTTAMQSVSRLAEHKNIRFLVNMPPDPVVISTNPVIARQVLIHILSQTIQQVEPGEVTLTLKDSDEGPSLIICDEGSQIKVTSVVSQLVDQLKWRLLDECLLCLHMNTFDTTVLIIDDNEGLLDLLKRYLNGKQYQVVATTQALEGLRLAEKLQPSVIILDLMMPGMDGWELLQRIRTTPDTRNLPVIICSVINDPELAYSLGASMFVAKPVTKEKILAALQSINI